MIRNREESAAGERFVDNKTGEVSGMKRMIALLCAVLTIPWVALSETAVLRFETVGRATNGDLIRRCILPEGQPLYFTAMDEQGAYEWADVNFDGHDDLVIHVASGASNRFSEFFVYDAATGWYHPVEHIGLDEGFGNYALKDGYIVSHQTDGSAGLLHETYIFRWEDGALRLLRQAVATNRQEWAMTGEGEQTILYHDEVEMYILDFTMAAADGETIWSRTVRTGTEDVYAALEEEEKALWQGL